MIRFFAGPGERPPGVSPRLLPGTCFLDLDSYPGSLFHSFSCLVQHLILRHHVREEGCLRLSNTRTWVKLNDCERVLTIWDDFMKTQTQTSPFTLRDLSSRGLLFILLDRGRSDKKRAEMYQDICA